jgi:hypothetical protein
MKNVVETGRSEILSHIFLTLIAQVLMHKNVKKIRLEENNVSSTVYSYTK